jgi:hypothetical protein
MAEHRHRLPGLTTALAEARRGRYVFPCEEYDKKPHPEVRSWADAATNDVAEIRRRGWPAGANVAIACKPSGLLVADPDRHDADGVAAFSELTARAYHDQYKCNREYCPGHWPDTYTVQTPTDGLHFYFLNPDPSRFGNSRGSLPRSIDVRGGGRGDGGYVLAAGSVLDRRAYEGKPELQALVGDGKAYRVHNGAEVSEPPAWLLERLDAGPPARGGGGIKRPLWSVKVENPRTLRKRLNGAIQKLRDEPAGNRNDLLFWTACTVGEAVAAGRVDPMDAETDLMAAMDENGYLSGHDEYTARGTIRSGFMTAGAL